MDIVRAVRSMRRSAALMALVVFAMPVPLAGPASAAHSFTISEGVYRIPFDDGIALTITGDHHDHNPVDRIDMVAGIGQPVVAAASGTIRAIVDPTGTSRAQEMGWTSSRDARNDALEHSCQDGTPAVPNSFVTGLCKEYNNYVWIEHPNGEWTKYTHFGTGTVTALGWVVGKPERSSPRRGVVTVGTSGPDVIYGTEGNDRIAGLGGDDVVFGLGATTT